MAKALWDESLAIGVEQIDGQHRELFSRFEKLLDACKEGRGRDELNRILEFLNDYVHEHFAAEEEFMASSGYAELPEHQGEHEVFRGKLDDLRQIYADNGAGMDLLITTNATVLDWIIQHVRKTDKRMGQALGN